MEPHQLSNYVKSVDPEIWIDQLVGFEWVEWRNNLMLFLTKSFEFKAHNQDEFVEQLCPFLPYLEPNHVVQLFDGVTENKKVQFAGPPLFLDQCAYNLELVLDTEQSIVYFICLSCFQKLSDPAILFESIACEYSHKHWNNILLSHRESTTRWFIQRFRFVDHQAPDCLKTPTSIFELFVYYDQALGHLIKSCFLAKNFNSPMNNHIKFISHELLFRIEMEDLTHPTLDIWSSTCIYDGSGLFYDECRVCHLIMNPIYFRFSVMPPVTSTIYQYVTTRITIISEKHKLKNSIILDLNKLKEAHRVYQNYLNTLKIEDFDLIVSLQ